MSSDMTALQICIQCSEWSDLSIPFIHRALRDEHYDCLIAWIQSHEDHLKCFLNSYLLTDPANPITPSYQQAKMFVSRLLLTKESILSVLNIYNRQQRKDQPDEDQSYVDYMVITAILEIEGQPLLTTDQFWNEYDVLLAIEDRYGLMIEGWVPSDTHLAEAREEVMDMMAGTTPIDYESLNCNVALVASYQRAMRERKIRFWRTFHCAIFLGKVISSYHKHRYRPGGPESRLAQQRFETGDYQI